MFKTQKFCVHILKSSSGDMLKQQPKKEIGVCQGKRARKGILIKGEQQVSKGRSSTKELALVEHNFFCPVVYIHHNI